jgi:hypothetical protein
MIDEIDWKPKLMDEFHCLLQCLFPYDVPSNAIIHPIFFCQNGIFKYIQYPEVQIQREIILFPEGFY